LFDKIAAMAADIAKGMGGFAIPASRLVHFDKEIMNSIEYVFGNTVKIY